MSAVGLKSASCRGEKAPALATSQWHNVCSSQAQVNDGWHVIAPTGLAGRSSSMIANLRSRAPVAASRRTTEHVYLPTPAWWVRTKSFCASSGSPTFCDGTGTKRLWRGGWRRADERTEQDLKEWIKDCDEKRASAIDAALINVAAARPAKSAAL